MKYAVIAALALLLVPAGLCAAGPEMPVEMQKAQDITYYNGGVGVGERARMSQIFPLKVVLATAKGLYLNNAEIVIRGTGVGEVFRARADNGPWLIADVPPGTYTIEATLEGSTVKHPAVTISAGSRKVATLFWKTADVDMGL